MPTIDELHIQKLAEKDLSNEMKLTKLYKEFFKSEKAGGLVLLFVTILSILLANSFFKENYINFWNHQLGSHSLVLWINDGLMTIFFLLIGLELVREVHRGELSDIKNASLPIFGAFGGMIVPAILFLLFNFGKATQSGAGIPMATDIAFALGVLSLLGKRVPSSLKIFLTALAVIDDLGAILVIAVFYTTSLAYINLFIALGIFGFLLVLNKLKVNNLIPYLIGGTIMWYFMLHSGVHATISGVLLALTIPLKSSREKSPSYILQHILHKPVAFFILPIFAIANTCISLNDNWYMGLGQDSSLGIIVGLILGKPLGILAFSFFGVSIGLCALPNGIKWKNILGAGFLGGIGFTMSIFITLLAFDKMDLVINSKIAIMVASLFSGIIGFTFLKLTLKKSSIAE